MAKTTLESLIGCTVRDTAGAEIGRVESIYVDDESGAPTWASVSTAGGGRSLMPLAGAQYRAEDNSLSVRVDRDRVRTAPHLEHDGHLDPQAERELLAYYSSGQRPRTEAMGDRRIRQAADAPMTYGNDDSEGLLISEERLVADTEREEVGTARLHKYVVEEQQTVTVPTSHEEVRIERRPVTGEMTRADIGEEVQEVTLHADRVRIDTETVPVERVRLAVDEVAGEQAVSGTVRKERIETEGIDNRENHEGA